MGASGMDHFMTSRCQLDPSFRNKYNKSPHGRRRFALEVGGNQGLQQHQAGTDYWHMFFERCVGWKCWHGTLFVFFWVRFTVLQNRFLEMMYLSFLSFIEWFQTPCTPGSSSAAKFAGAKHFTPETFGIFSRQCVFFFRQTHWFRKRKHPWCRLSWKHFWGYHLTHPWLKVWGWLLLWLGHSTMKLSLPISGADCLHDPGESVTRTRDLRGIRADR